ncbi:P-loop NTPase [Chloroflexota bacterium]
MGAFHCPMGTPFYEGEGCILCGLCVAETRENMIKSSEKVRAYLRSLPERKSNFKKVVVCGKGGSGKSTVVALMADVLKEEGYGVLVVDTDESNPGLYRMFGFTEQPRPLMKLLSRFSAGEPELDTGWITQDEISMYDIPPNYVLGSDGLKFVMVGKILDPFQGCACSMADVTRDLVKKIVLGENEVLLIDAEAGIESFGRGVERNVDTVLVVVEPSFESMDLAERISYMADGIGVRMVKAVLNKVPSEEIRRKVIEGLVQRNVSQIGAVNADPAVSGAGLEGRALGASAAREEIRQIVRRLLNEVGRKGQSGR